MSSRTVSVGACYGMGDAMMIQAVLKARGIEAIIPGLGSGALAYASGFSSQILVDAEAAEEATALIAELRSNQPAAGEAEGEDGEDDAAGPERDGRALAAVAAGEGAATARRQWIGATLVVSLCVTFGLGHLVNRAWGRAMTLAGIEGLGLSYLLDGAHGRLGLALVLGAIALDVAGSLTLTRRGRPAQRRAPLPQARLRK